MTAPRAQPATEGVPPGVLVFDIESDGMIQYSSAFQATEGFVKLFGYQHGFELHSTASHERMAKLLNAAGKLVGHNIMNSDLIPFHLAGVIDIVELARQGRLYDTQLVEALLNPPPVWMPPARVPVEYKLDSLGQKKFGVGSVEAAQRMNNFLLSPRPRRSVRNRSTE